MKEICGITVHSYSVNDGEAYGAMQVEYTVRDTVDPLLKKTLTIALDPAGDDLTAVQAAMVSVANQIKALEGIS